MDSDNSDDQDSGACNEIFVNVIYNVSTLAYQVISTS